MESDKEKMIVEYLPLVKYVVDRLPFASLPQVSREDLISSGIIGLLKAVESFDPSRGIKFKTYAIPRIRGAIIDELRRLDWIPRSLRKKASHLEEAYFSLERKLGRAPTESELSKELNICEEELFKLIAHVNCFSPVSLENEVTGEGKSLLEKIASSEAENPIEVLEKKEIKERIREVLEKLPFREKMVIILYYYEELTFKEIGRVLGVSESRVSQIHGRVMLKLRSTLSKLKKSLF